MDKVLPGKISILISFKEKFFTYVNSQQMWMKFNTFSSYSRVDCDSDKGDVRFAAFSYNLFIFLRERILHEHL